MDRITVPALVGNLTDVFNCVSGAMRNAGSSLKQEQLNNIQIAVEEVFVNIASYAYDSDKGGDGEVTVSVSVAPENLVIEFEDSGTPYNPLAEADPNTSLSADEREIGGLGIFMVKKLMDDVRYRHEGGKNILTLEKKL